MHHLIYSTLLYLLIPFVVLRLFIRSFKNADYRGRIAERFGFIPQSDDNIVIWLHAVSVGETIAAQPLIEKLVEKYGDRRVLVTTTTPTGAHTVERLFAGRVVHHYFPYDLPGVVKRYLGKINPQVLICMETEIWPNLWRACKNNHIPVVLANARMSERSANRYQRLQGFIQKALNDASLIACRNEKDARRFIDIGAPVSSVSVVGDVKLDIQLQDVDKEIGLGFRSQWGTQRLVFTAASTHEGEDEQVLAMYRTLRESLADLLLILVPRHPERFDDVARLVVNEGFDLQRRSSGGSFNPEVDVVLGDSMGEMMRWYCASDVVFMGGSLVPTGGHNPMEPLACQIPVISGPHVFNFEQAFRELSTVEAVFVADDAMQLSDLAKLLLTDEELRHRSGKSGLELVNKGRGATTRLVAEINQRVSLD